MTKRRWRESRVLQRLQVWIIFDVLVTLTPFAFGYFQSIDKNKTFQISNVLGSGQLLLVCVAISASAIGELVAIEVSEKQKFMKTAAIGLAFIVVIVSTYWFGDISASISGETTPDQKTISFGSMFIYAWALCVSAWCLTLSQSRTQPLDRPKFEETAEEPLLTQDDEEN